MIDRLWAGWQLAAQQNALSFSGGSVQARETFAIYQAFPNGGPPFLDVSRTDPTFSSLLTVCHTVRVRDAERWIVGRREGHRRNGHEE